MALSRALQALVAAERHYLGYREGPNNDTKFGAWIGINHAAWCDSFQHYCAYGLGWRFPGSQFGDKGDASVGFTVAWHKARGLWSRDPVDGAFVIYDWGGRGNWSEYHIELLVEHTSTRNLVIGGNVGDTVKEQWRSRYAVIGYCVLPTLGITPAPIPAPRPVPIDMGADELNAEELKTLHDALAAATAANVNAMEAKRAAQASEKALGDINKLLLKNVEAGTLVGP